MRSNCVAFLTGKASRVFLVAAFSLVAAASAHAFTPTEAQREACTPDAFRLCSSEIPDIGRVTSCMIAKKASLSAPCRAVFAAAAGEAAPASHRHHEYAAVVAEEHHHVHRIHDAYESHHHHMHRIAEASEHHHHMHRMHSAYERHHHKAHWKRYAYNHEAHHRWAGR